MYVCLACVYVGLLIGCTYSWHPSKKTFQNKPVCMYMHGPKSMYMYKGMYIYIHTYVKKQEETVKKGLTAYVYTQSDEAQSMGICMYVDVYTSIHIYGRH